MTLATVVSGDAPTLLPKPGTTPLVLGERTSGENASLDAAMDRYARGEDAAFEEVYDKLAPRLYGFLLRHTRDRAKAEDIVQQTMLQIHRARGRFIPGAQVMPWAFAIARRLLIDQHRRGGREVLASSDDESAEELLASLDAGADELAIAKEVAARLDDELQRLPEKQRVAFELIKQDGLSVAEAAQVLGTTAAAVKLRAHRAYEALRAVLSMERAARTGRGGDHDERTTAAGSERKAKI
jgi:RNA polymerase sigma-70 factor, ECF subfamily